MWSDLSPIFFHPAAAAVLLFAAVYALLLALSARRSRTAAAPPPYHDIEHALPVRGPAAVGPGAPNRKFRPVRAYRHAPTALMSATSTLGARPLPVLPPSMSIYPGTVGKTTAPWWLTKEAISSSLPSTATPDRIAIVCGPSGVGKSTILKRAVAEHPDRYQFCISHTSRPRRPNERDGVDYHFVSRDEALRMVQDNQFVEWTEVYGHVYGTSYASLHAGSTTPGRVCLVDINSDGVVSLLKQGGFNPHVTLIAPPSIQTLAARLSFRNTEDARNVAARLSASEKELTVLTPLADKIIVNGDVDQAVETLHDVLADAFHLPNNRTSVRKFFGGVQQQQLHRTRVQNQTKPNRHIRTVATPSHLPIKPNQARDKTDTAMSGIFGLGGGELVVIAGIAALILGPSSLKGLAKDVGKIAAELKDVPAEFKEGMAEASPYEVEAEEPKVLEGEVKSD